MIGMREFIVSLKQFWLDLKRRHITKEITTVFDEEAA